MADKEEEKSLVQKAIDFAFGSPEAHTPSRQLNRKERRTRLSIARKQAVRKRRKKFSGRKR